MIEKQYKDVHTQSNYQTISSKHLNLNLEIDFDAKKLNGYAEHVLDNPDKHIYFVLDTRDLDIEKVVLDDKNVADFSLGEERKHLGKPLTVKITPDTKRVKIYYQTSPEAGALQWLSPQQTEGKSFPFLFSQSESILARTWIPCQDTPSVRFTYSATLKVPQNILPVMSATNPTTKNRQGIYYFEMKQPVPSYLLAIAAGDLEYRKISHRTGVFAEPSKIEAARYEFERIEDMIQTAENLYGEYLWEQFDIIVLPPSFPFGGMENPRLTFATPTILAGDRSLTNLVAHELAHSWSGNLVTNATWNDFWINEGFTVYFERRIMEKIEDKSYAEMLIYLGLQELKDTIKDLGEDSKDTHLYLDLAGRDADDGMTLIAYEKGFFFLLTLEKAIGRKRMDEFLNKYFREFAFKSMNTRKFLDYLQQEVIKNDKELEQKIKPDKWIFNPGLPDTCPVVKSERFEKVDKEANDWLVGKRKANQLKTENWSTHEWLYFLRKMPDTIGKGAIAELDVIFDFTHSNNSEILCAWLRLAILNSYEEVNFVLEMFLIRVGRRKFQIPLYKALLETDKGKKLAKQIYSKARENYHYVSRNTLDEMITD